MTRRVVIDRNALDQGIAIINFADCRIRGRTARLLRARAREAVPSAVSRAAVSKVALYLTAESFDLFGFLIIYFGQVRVSSVCDTQEIV